MKHTQSVSFYSLTIGGFLLLNLGLPFPAAALNKNITITFAGLGTGTVVVDDTTDNGFDGNCTASCSHAVGNDDVGTLTATGSGGSVFFSWTSQSAGITGCAGNTCNFSMGNSAQSVTVTFNPPPTSPPTSTPTITATLTPTRTPTRTATSTPTLTPTMMSSGQTEICDNGIDDNANQLIDCADPQCFGDLLCVAVAPTTSAPLTLLLAVSLATIGFFIVGMKRRRPQQQNP